MKSAIFTLAFVMFGCDESGPTVTRLTVAELCRRAGIEPDDIVDGAHKWKRKPQIMTLD